MARSPFLCFLCITVLAATVIIGISGASTTAPHYSGARAVTLLSGASTTAPPYWPRYSGARAVTLLDGQWSYGLLPSPTDFDAMDPAFGPSSPRASTPNVTQVPSCMDVAPPGYMGTRGVALYRTTFAHAGAAVLQFQACSFYCRVWVDGVEIGEHLAGGYVAFSLDVPQAADADANRSRELFVMADNRFNKTTAPMHTGGDFWSYGGLMRSVELHTVPGNANDAGADAAGADAAQNAGPWPWRADVLPAAPAAGATFPTAVNIRVVLLTAPTVSSPALGEGARVNVTLAFDGGPPRAYAATVGADGALALDGVAVPGAHPWSTRSPHLHTVTVTIAGGAVTERFGLRTFGVDAATARFTLNNETVKLVGFNHHTQWPGTGASPTDAQIDADIALLLAAGTNYVRGSHYPQDPRWLDRLDEAGIVMWCETLGPGVRLRDTQDPAWMKIQLTQLAEMQDNAINHASVFAWGWFNEGPSNDAAACPAYAANAAQARARDPTRFTTWASDKDLKDKCLASASLVAFNNYPGWYVDPGDTSAPHRVWTEFADGVFAGKTASGAAATVGKPFVISETGAGGIYEWAHNKSAAKWTLKYQTEIVSADVDVAIANDHISGLTIWHFMDFKVDDANEHDTHCEYEPHVWPPTCAYIKIDQRPGGENHKGVVDFWRRKKPAYEVVAAKYNATHH